MADTPAQGFQDFGARLKAVTSGLLWVDMDILRTTLGSPRAFKRSRILDFPDAPVVRTQCCLCRGQFPSLTGKLIPHMAHGQKKKKA